MGTCKYCGLKAGLLSHAHKECKLKHEKGVADFTATANSYFMLRITAIDVMKAKDRLKADAYLSDDDLCQCSDAALRAYTASIHRPFSPKELRLVDDYLNAVGVEYSKITQSGAVDEFIKKLLKGFMVEYFTGKLTLPVAHQRCEKVLKTLPMLQPDIEDAYLYVLNKAATNFMKNGIITDDEQSKIDDYVQYLGLPINNLPATYQNSEISKLGQMSILKEIQRGIVPRTNVSAPIILGRNESVLWTYAGVSLYQEKITKEWVGSRSGTSYRIMKGVYYHTGGSHGHTVEHSSMELEGTGSLFVTNKNLIFHSSSKALKIPFSKIVGITPYSDGIEVHKDDANAKRIAMQGFDPWFLMNLLSQIGNI